MTSVRMIVLMTLAASFWAAEPALSQQVGGGANALSLDSLLNVRISTASRSAQTMSEAPASVTIITAEDIERYGYRTLDEVLTTIKGFYRSYDRNYVYIGVRGFGRPSDYNDRLLLMLNGHTMNDNFYGSASLGTDFPIDIGSIERIEIVRGPGSALYGTGAMFAVINVITKKGGNVDGVRVSGETGSFGRAQGSILAGTRLDNGLDLSLSGTWANIAGHDLFYSQYDAPATNNGIAHNLDWDKYYSTFGRVSYSGLDLSGFYSSRRKGIPTGAFGIVFDDSRAHTLDRTGYLELKYRSAIGYDKSITAKASYFDYYYDGEYPYVIDSFDATDAALWEGDLQFQWDLLSSNRLVTGVEWRHNTHASYQAWTPGFVYFNGDFPYDVISVYGQDEFQLLENLLVTGGVRWDDNSVNGNSITPRGALVFYPFKTSTWKLLYGEGFRAPNLYETYFSDPVSGFKSNPSLRPERIRTLETDWEQRFGGHSFGSISLYQFSMDNLIDTGIDPRDSLTQFQNISTVTAYGLELDFETRWSSGLTAYANYTYQDARDTRTRQTLTNVPEHIVHTGITCPVFEFLAASFELQYETGRKTVYGSSTNPFLLVNVNVVAKHIVGNLTGAVLVRNILNTPYSTPGGYEHLEPAIPQDGRNYTIRVDYSF